MKPFKTVLNAIWEAIAMGLCLIALSVIWLIDRFFKRDDED